MGRGNPSDQDIDKSQARIKQSPSRAISAPQVYKGKSPQDLTLTVSRIYALIIFALEQSSGAQQNHRRNDEHSGYGGDGRVDLIA